MIKGIAEIFNEVKKAKSVNQKIKILHDHDGGETAPDYMPDIFIRIRYVDI